MESRWHSCLPILSRHVRSRTRPLRSSAFWSSRLVNFRQDSPLLNPLSRIHVNFNYLYKQSQLSLGEQPVRDYYIDLVPSVGFKIDLTSKDRDRIADLKILVLGATSGIGLALSERFIERGIFVIAVGRRKQNLDEFVQKHGSDKTVAIQFDISKLDAIPAFAENVIKSHPDLDCIFLNSGMQRGADFSKPESLDISLLVEEMTVNYLSYLALSKAFLPFLLAKKEPTSLIATSSGLSMIPLYRCPNYSASKAALHHWLLVLRWQLRDTNVKVIEIFPPAVQTELHDAKYQPDIIDGRNLGMPLKDFTDETMEGLLGGKDQIPVGMSKIAFDSWEQERQKGFAKMTEITKADADRKAAAAAAAAAASGN
ncbi:hypothetical protein DTO217A2_4057 [Paecilomyces variotii]|nr:hypothetical protein DTO217A2_4057 [Paecilomyces variotii]